MSAAYPHGLDVVWLATDRDGNLAVFITAGEAPVPVGALEQFSDLAEPMESRLLDLPAVSEQRLLLKKGKADSFLALAARGLFVFDWGATYLTYTAVALPLSPITIDDLPEDLAAAANVARMETLLFAGADAVTMTDHFDCIDGDG